MIDVVNIRRALISVSDKTGLVELGTALAAKKVEILSTGGSARTLRNAGMNVTEVADYTGFPEILDGRVKTLVPKIHGGLLGRRDLPDNIRKQQKFRKRVNPSPDEIDPDYVKPLLPQRSRRRSHARQNSYAPARLTRRAGARNKMRCEEPVLAD